MKETVILRTLRLAKERKGWNQKELAARMGVLPQHITNWKARGMPADQHERAASEIGVSVDELLGRVLPHAAVPMRGDVEEIANILYGWSKERVAAVRFYMHSIAPAAADDAVERAFKVPPPLPAIKR